MKYLKFVLIFLLTMFVIIYAPCLFAENVNAGELNTTVDINDLAFIDLTDYSCYDNFYSIDDLSFDHADDDSTPENTKTFEQRYHDRELSFDEWVSYHGFDLDEVDHGMSNFRYEYRMYLDGYGP